MDNADLRFEELLNLIEQGSIKSGDMADTQAGMFTLQHPLYRKSNSAILPIDSTTEIYDAIANNENIYLDYNTQMSFLTPSNDICEDYSEFILDDLDALCFISDVFFITYGLTTINSFNKDLPYLIVFLSVSGDNENAPEQLERIITTKGGYKRDVDLVDSGNSTNLLDNTYRVNIRNISQFKMLKLFDFNLFMITIYDQSMRNIIDNPDVLTYYRGVTTIIPQLNDAIIRL